MKKVLLSTIITVLTILSAVAQQKSFGYSNPVIPGYYPDPSVCRVGDDFYLVNSTFHYFPGVPVFHSKDLINWTQIGNCLTRESQLELYDSYHSGGIFAPTIRYNDGVFYMITTNVSSKGNFYVTTTDPTGEWSEPIWLEQGGIDPSFYFEDGKCYFSSIPGGGISLCEIDPKTGKQLTPTRKIWDGTGGRYPEGPHIYKKDGYYYLLIAEGGTEYGHKVTIARSRDIYGPYESNPANPILTHIGMNAQDSPIQGIGHADFIQAADGSWWSVCLAFRPQSYLHHLLGRETFLVPMTWERNAWPIINGDGTMQLEMECKTLPQQPKTSEPTRLDFDSEKMPLNWCYLFNPKMENYSLAERKGHLSLRPTAIHTDGWGSPTFVGRRQQHIDCQATTSIELNGCETGVEGGLSVYMTNRYHYDISTTQLTGGKQSVKLFCRLGEIGHTVGEVTVPKGKVFFRIVAEPDFYNFYYSTNGKDFKSLGKADTRFLSSETAGGFTGVMFGLYAAGGKKRGSVDFDWFDYEPLNKK